ncbi:hypothetical protein V8J36_05360 [Frigidibacter sp. MR17.14]|uniref:hypothetical protein n=1 Tax=Frigidibacter sp. MR17.14 TaxID=3126509 RepID=UPI003012CCAA
MQLNATGLAKELSLTPARISQLVSSGKLDGCYSGAGRHRVFDLGRCADALGRRLDRGQMLGNGAATRRALAGIRQGELPTGPQIAAPQAPVEASPPAVPLESDRYEIARTQKAEEEARRLRRQNAQDEGLFLLASEAERQIGKVLAQELAEFETVLKEGARRIADRLGVDFKTARQILVETWREHRSKRATALDAHAVEAAMVPAEVEADI